MSEQPVKSLADNFGDKNNQYKPGESGNPTGRPPGAKDGVRAHYNRWLRLGASGNALDKLKSLGFELDDPTNAQALAFILGDMAVKGDLGAHKEINTQTEPDLPKELNMGGELQITKIKRVIVDTPQSPDVPTSPDDLNT